jgi:hypothetical protein
MDDKKDSFEITKRFMAQIDRDRRFYRTIQRGFDVNSVPVVRSVYSGDAGSSSNLGITYRE